MTRYGKQLAIYKRLCYQPKARGRRSSVAQTELNNTRNLKLQNENPLYLNDKQTAAITGWILPGSLDADGKPESTTITQKNPIKDHAVGHNGSNPYTDKQRSNVFHGIAGFFSKQGESWETIKNKDIPVIMNAPKEAWENLKNKANPVVMNVPKEAWETIKNKDIPVIMKVPNKAWKTIKSNVNPVIMNVPNVIQNLNQLKLIAKELMDKLESLRDPKTRKLKPEYKDFISFVSFITSLGLLVNRPNPKAARITQYFMDSFNNINMKNDVSSVNNALNCENENMNSINNDDIDLNGDVNSCNEDLKQSPEFQRFYENYKDSIRMANTYIEEAVQSFELVDNDQNKWVLEQLHKFKNQVAGIMAIGMIFVGTDANSEIPQAETSIAFDQVAENKSITEMNSEIPQAETSIAFDQVAENKSITEMSPVEPQTDTPDENNQVGDNVSILDQLWGLSKYGPTVIAISMLILGADTTSFGFVSVLYRLVCYFSKTDKM